MKQRPARGRYMQPHRHEFWVRERGFLSAILLLGIGILLRVSGLNWDAGAMLHADERYLVMVMSALSWPGSVTAYFDSAASPLNPLNLAELNWYVYGTLPLFLAKLFSELLTAAGFIDPTLPGRLLSAVVDTATIVAVFFLGRQVFNYRVGLASAVLYALSVLPIQLAHFFTVDPFLNFFLVLSLIQALRVAQTRAIAPTVLLGLWWGCALASKISAGLFAPIVLAALLLGTRGAGTLRFLAHSALCAVSALLVFRLLQPYAFSGWLTLDPRFLSALANLARLQDFETWSPPAFQWVGREVLLFPLGNMAMWGMGLLLFASGAGGALAAAVHQLRTPQSQFLLPLGWLAILVVASSFSSNPTMRYLLPAYPIMAILAASFLLPPDERVPRRILKHWPLILVVAATLLWALAFTAIYRSPMSRIAASDWIYENVPSGAVIGVEYWDDSLPVNRPGNSTSRYESRVLRLTDPETQTKREALLQDLVAVDYVLISSNRGYGSLSRLVDQMPLAARFYELLFGGLAGFQLVAEFDSYPRLAGSVIADDTAEEAFTVHDHPRVFIFAKAADFSLQALAADLQAVVLPDHPDRLHPELTGTSPVLQPVTGTLLQRVNDAQRLHLLHWILLLWLAGISGNALSRRLWPEAGFPGRTLLLTAGAYLFAVGLKTNLWTSQIGVLLLLTGLVGSSLLIIRRGGSGLRGQIQLTGEAVFWGCFVFFLVLRAHNPAIAWGERPMDFAILNAFMRAENLPPVDPWFAGSPLQYHSWGHYFMSVLGRAAGTPPAMLYNLAAAVTPALAAELLFWILVRLTSTGQPRVWPALAGTLLVLFSGNLYFWTQLPGTSATSFEDFWRASRIIPGTINEFPFWSAVFADLHSHFLGMIFSALFLAALVLWRTEDQPLPSCGLLALALASLALCNTWALPVYLTLLLLCALASQGTLKWRQATAVALASLALVLPFWGAAANRLDVQLVTAPAALMEGLVLFGPFFGVMLLWCLHREPAPKLVAALVMVALLLALVIGDLRGTTAALVFLLLARLHRQPRTPQEELTGMLALCALLTLLGSEYFTLVDRVNTVFKYQFEAWILLALASAAAVAQMAARCRRLAAAGCLLLLLGLPTSLHSLLAWWNNPKIQAQGPTLDGLLFLAADQPGEAQVAAWLNLLPGQPVILEAAGPAYGNYARMSSRTGLPTLLGWPYHVWQHGHDHGTILLRQQQVHAAYTSLAGARAAQHLGVSYAVRCQLEKDTYGREAGRFWEAAGWRPVFRIADCDIWKTANKVAQQ